MKSIQNVLFLVPLIQPLQAQFLPEADARLLAWRAYGNFVSQFLTAGVPLSPGKDFVYVTPPTLAAVRGGTPCPESVTNYDLFGLADGLQNISDPLLDPQGPSYIDNLYTYLESVDLGTATPTAAQLAKIQQLTATLHAAQDQFDAEGDSAYTRYLADARAQATKQAFGSWINQHDPVYTSYKRQVQTANAALQNYEISVYGPQYRTLTAQRDKIDVQADDELSLEPGYNMPVYPNSYNVVLNPWAQHEQTDGILYKPLYSLQGGFEEACDAWFNGTSGGTTSYNWNMKNVNGRDWSSLGHSTSVSQVGGSFFSLLSASHSSSSDTTQFNSWTTKFSTQLTLELTMRGAPLVFNIGAGYWDIGGVRNTYPTLLKTGVDTLKNKVRLQKLLIGYEIGLKITINDTGMWQSVSQFIQNAQKSTGGGFSIFGFHFGAGGSSVTHRNVTDVQLTTMQAGGQVVIPPSPPGITFMLGALGKAL